MRAVTFRQLIKKHLIRLLVDSPLYALIMAILLIPIAAVVNMIGLDSKIVVSLMIAILIAFVVLVSLAIGEFSLSVILERKNR